MFGIGLKAKASLRLTEGETDEWKEETTTEINKKYQPQYIYCRWDLVDELTSHVTTRTSVDAADKQSSRPPVLSDALFKSTAVVYEDGAADITAKFLTEAVKSYGLSKMKKVVLSAPMQVE